MKSTISILLLFLNLSLLAQSNVVSEEILIFNDSIQLPGTLTFDKNLNKQPLVIFIHGSGNVDRDGNQLGTVAKANYIKQLSDSLTSRGIAFYRYDKRTATMANLKFLMKDLHFERFVEDANLAVDKFKDDPRFSSITILGHSQGSLVGMLLANRTKVDKYISLAGASQPFDELFISQIRTQNGDSIANIAADHFNQLKEKGFIDNVNPNLVSVFNKPNQVFFTSWMKYNPSEEIKKLKIPTLILNGDKDLQVAIEDANKLHQSNNGSQVVIIKNMNHVMKTIEKDEDNIKSYTVPDFPLSSELVTTIETFIKQ